MTVPTAILTGATIAVIGAIKRKIVIPKYLSTVVI